MNDFIKFWAPVILWSALIFYFSTDAFSFPNTSLIIDPLLLWILPNASPEQLEIFHGAIRKSAHWIEYFILALLLMRALREGKSNACSGKRIGWTLVVVLCYGLSDEFHQIFVPSRSPLLRDVMLDVFGGGCGVFWLYLRQTILMARVRE